MNDLHHSCGPWAERISLAAAGCLAPDDQRETRRHIETCSDCRKRFRQLTDLCGVLAEARLPAESSEAAIVERVMSAVTSDESRRRFVRTRVEIIRPTLLTRSLDKWRWIMRSPVSRVAAAAILILAVTGVALWFHGAGTTPAFADFLQPFLEAKTVKYKVTTERTGLSARMKLLPAESQQNLMKTTTSEVMVLNATRMRTESGRSGKSETMLIWDGNQGKTLELRPAEKKAMVYTSVNRPNQDPLADVVTLFRSVLLDARDKPDVKRESLGEKDIDGRHVVGFRKTSPGRVTNVWGDPKTGLPVRIETILATSKLKITMSDFEFNVDMDESLFSVEPPAGYEVKARTTDFSSPEEKDLIEMFREFSELGGGTFPDLLDRESIVGMASSLRNTAITLENTFNSLKQPYKASEKQVQEWLEAQAKLSRGWAFTDRLPQEADSHYAGKRVSLGAVDTPIFWYRPKDAKKYRVIFADLSVSEVDTPPSVPVAQREKDRDLIEMFRKYSELSGGPFPHSLHFPSLLRVLTTKKYSSNSLEQRRETAEAQVKLQRGLMFAARLSKEADAHYAGKGVWLGATDTPIFWYRPKDSKKYWAIYANLSVSEVDTPPSVPDAQPVPAPYSARSATSSRTITTIVHRAPDKKADIGKPIGTNASCSDNPKVWTMTQSMRPDSIKVGLGRQSVKGKLDWLERGKDFAYDETLATITLLREIPLEEDSWMFVSGVPTKHGRILLHSELTKGEVEVTLGGRLLKEGVDYEVDYEQGIVTIVDKAIKKKDEKCRISVGGH